MKRRVKRGRTKSGRFTKGSRAAKAAGRKGGRKTARRRRR
jgi:hypothetical protein